MDTAGPAPPPRAPVRVLTLQVQRAWALATRQALAMALGGAALFVVLRPWVPAGDRLTWVLLLVIGLATHAAGLVVARLAPIDVRSAVRWREIRMLTGGALGLAWGASAVLLLPPGADPAARSVVLFLLSAVTAANVLTCGGMVRVFVVDSVALWMPVTASYALGGALAEEGWTLGASLVFLVVMTGFVRIHAETTERELALRVENEALLAQLAAANDELRESLADRQRMVQRLETSLGIDELTAAHNRRWFMARLDEELQRAARYGDTFSVALLDIDQFKRINDTWGHAVGDLALRTFSATVAEQLRTVDAFARVGGEEFAVLLPHTDTDDAVRVLDRLRHHIASTRIDGPSPFHLTVSIGIVAAGPGWTADEVLRHADVALYRAKKRGRDRVEVAERGR